MVPRDNVPRDNVPQDNVPQDNPPWRQWAPDMICLGNNIPGDNLPQRQPRECVMEATRPGKNVPRQTICPRAPCPSTQFQQWNCMKVQPIWKGTRCASAPGSIAYQILLLNVITLGQFPIFHICDLSIASLCSRAQCVIPLNGIFFQFFCIICSDSLCFRWLPTCHDGWRKVPGLSPGRVLDKRARNW